MSDNRLAAAFFIPRQQSVSQLADLAGAAGVEDVYREPVGAEQVVYGRWAGIDGTEVRLDALQAHDCLQLYFWQSSFFELLTDEDDDTLPLEDDGALIVVRAFQAACERLQPEVALILTHLHESNQEWIRNQYDLVVRRDPTLLADQTYGLLYVSQALLKGTPIKTRYPNRDAIASPQGIFLFSGRGWGRWF